jgi:hypothetical protein
MSVEVVYLGIKIFVLVAVNIGLLNEGGSAKSEDFVLHRQKTMGVLVGGQGTVVS